MTGLRAFVAFGANLGDGVKAFERACKALDELPGTMLSATSSLYRSAPIGVTGHPDYINAVVELKTTLDASALLQALLGIEAGHGRTRSHTVVPRTMDLDLLLHGKNVIDSPQLTLPHPRMHQRAFVLQPLAELAPDLIIPQHGPILPLLARIEGQQIERLSTD